MYAEVAVYLPLYQRYSYAIPTEMRESLQVGQLVEVPFGTAKEYGVVMDITPDKPADVEAVKPLHALISLEPFVTPLQLAVARWMAARWLAPIGYCVWQWLPPGLTNGRDVRVTLLDPAATSKDRAANILLGLLQKRGALTGQQLESAQAMQGVTWRDALKRLESDGVVRVEPILSPPRVRAKVIQTVALTIHPEYIPAAVRSLGQVSKPADILEALAAMRHPNPTAREVLAAAGASNKEPLQKLVEAGLVKLQDGVVTLEIPLYQVDSHLIRLRRAEKYMHILRVLAREPNMVDVSWVYAQASCNRADLQHLEEAGLVVLAEQPTWRDSLADRAFVPLTPPPLLPEQAAVWETIHAALQTPVLTARYAVSPKGEEPPPPPLSVTPQTAGEGSQSSIPPLPTEKGVGGEVPASSKVFLLHGVTGSGKTEIYLRAIAEVLAQGRQAIFLVPEIALTAQTVRRVAARFTKQVAVLHSRLSDGERYDTWRRARAGLVKIIVGPRSALFAPLPNIGLIILDEEHDASYKNQESPRYHSRDVAEYLAQLNGATVILGSATPSLETLYRAQTHPLLLSERRDAIDGVLLSNDEANSEERTRYSTSTHGQSDHTTPLIPALVTENGLDCKVIRLSLPTRIISHRLRVEEQAEQVGIQPAYHRAGADALTIDLPAVQVVDMREELKDGNTSIFSRALQTALGETLRRREQAILFLNRRGASTYVFCRDCGAVAACPHCDTPLTFHRTDEHLRCHRCGFTQPTPETCPNCQSQRIKYFGAGTQQIEQAIGALFPTVRTLRWDADTASTSDMHDYFLQRFIERKADVLIGTQMIAKGLDLPMVTLVGVVSADMALNLPDFRAGERTFQLLTQVAGRAGRGLRGGRVILQSYQPEHYAIQHAARHDSDGFYAQEIAYRRALGYPPFRRLVRIVFTSHNEGRAQSDAQEAAALLRARLLRLGMTQTEVIGPAPCFFGRVNDAYRWQVILRGVNPVAALQGLDPQRGWQVDVDPVEML